MGSRLQLHEILTGLIAPNKVYFQPPEDLKLIYPCIIYSRGTIDTTMYADDKPYQNKMRYDLIIVDKNPDSELFDKVASLPMCKFQRHYTADNLNHDIYNLYY